MGRPPRRLCLAAGYQRFQGPSPSFFFFSFFFPEEVCIESFKKERKNKKK